MRDKDLYQQILGIASPWRVTDVELDLKEEAVTVRVALEPGAQLVCPECGQPCAGYDRRERRWRHLDTCQFRTILAAELPRVECPDARRASGRRAVGRGRIGFHGAVRGAGDRLVARGFDRGGGAADAAFLERHRHDHAAGGRARFAAPPGRVAAPSERG